MNVHASSLSEPLWNSVPYIRRYFYKSLYKKVPKRIKRLIFVASILALVDGTKEINKTLASKLNLILQVAYNVEAMYFPMAVKSIIWKSVIKNPLVTIAGNTYNIKDLNDIRVLDPDLSNVSAFLIDRMPAWLVYGSRDLMHRDIQVLFQKVLP